ncbi:hypothetical protein BN14_07662 [Rhizoctonia solani AG-1 IB]|uniref:GH18 domain-containing protein n=1 Tax=Thanatephorus cucumeris (strain AG1-IB / isolate 7/3/14) TaxID=1108050 RepID=M5C0U6_THACB|nr:hypothetical protein BN14_07662 [Rhizoctonia solani AG-1 IB]
MISASANCATFIASVKSFLTTYKLNGIDIDIEYPASIKRGGPPSDTPNLTTFFKELRSGLPSTEISLATSSSYWFLKGFELDKIAPSVSFINMMSYDYHSPWNTTVNGVNSSALPQTSLEEIKESVLLHTRIGIDMAKGDPPEMRIAKKNFAAKTCFGGTMVWSMDQIDPPANTTPPPGNPCTDAKTWAKDYVALEIKSFFQEHTDPTTPPGGSMSMPGGYGCYPKTEHLWHEVQTAMEGVVNYAMITWDNQYKYGITSAGFAFTDAAVQFILIPGSFYDSHDDALRTVLLYFKIDEWLEKIGSKDSRYWTKTKSYLDDATTAWKFLKDKMRRGSSNPKLGLFSGGTSLPGCTDNMQETWTYNQGVVLHALGLLYKATGSRTYVDEALVTLDAVIKYKTKDNILIETCDLPGNKCNFDQVRRSADAL